MPHSPPPHPRRRRRIHGVLFGRVGRGTLAGFYAQFVQLGIQLISVPVLTSQWGLAGYGVWVLLFTVPQMLAMADLGLSAAGANAMTAAAARDDRPAVSRIYASLRWTSLGMALTIGALVCLYVFVWQPHTLDFAQAYTHERAWLTLLAVMAYTVLAMQNAVTAAGFRAADAFATWQTAYDTCQLIETLAALAAAIAGMGMEAVALTYLGCRILFSALLAGWLMRLAPWMSAQGWAIDLTEIRKLLSPAFAAFMLPAAQAITLQGSVMAIGAVAGPAAVPAFSTLRTLSRTALQFTYRFNFATMPRYTVLHATGDDIGKAKLVLANLLVTACLLLPAAPILYVLGQPIIALWTSGVVHPSAPLLALMLAIMVLNGAWVPLSNLLCSINEHARFTYVYLFASAASITIGTVMARSAGAEGMAMALMALELVMLAWVWRQALRLGMLQTDLLGAAWHAILGKGGSLLARRTKL